MSDTNRTLLEKADLVLADFASGGLLNPEQADRFIRLAVKQSAFMAAMCTVKPMGSYQQKFPKTRFTGRVLKPGTEATALPVAWRSKPTMSQVTLTAELLKAEVRMSDESLEDNIENGTFFQTIMAMLTEAIARDLDTLVINGDTHSTDPLLAVLDGVLHQATSNTVNGSSGRLTKTILRDTIKALDDEFANDPSLKFATNRQARFDWRDSLADRATPLADQAIVGQTAGNQYQDYPILAIPEFPPTTETGGSNTQVLFGSPSNFLVGIYKGIRIETDRDVSAGMNIIVARLRADADVVETTAAARAYAVLGT